MMDNCISLMMQALGRRYVRYFNYTYQRSGTLWEGRFKSCVISAEEYFFICQRYIELNPVRANMVAHPADYKWSSYRFHAQESLDLQSELWQPLNFISNLVVSRKRERSVTKPYSNTTSQKKSSDGFDPLRIQIWHWETNALKKRLRS